MKVIYSHSLAQAVKLGIIESGVLTGSGIEADSLADVSLENFRDVVAFKNEIFRLLIPLSVPQTSGIATQPQSTLTRLCSNVSNKVRISIIKFIEAVIIQQCSQPSGSDVAFDSTKCPLDGIPRLTECQLVAIVGASTAKSSFTRLPGIYIVQPHRLLEEAERLFLGLQNLVLGSEVSEGFRYIMTSSVFESLLDTFVNIARQRPQLLDEIITFSERIQCSFPI
ncbi:hypothetical protein Aperf_G00000097372 [Anoplocephala perfoliata]